MDAYTSRQHSYTSVRAYVRRGVQDIRQELAVFARHGSKAGGSRRTERENGSREISSIIASVLRQYRVVKLSSMQAKRRVSDEGKRIKGMKARLEEGFAFDDGRFAISRRFDFFNPRRPSS